MASKNPELESLNEELRDLRDAGLISSLCTPAQKRKILELRERSTGNTLELVRSVCPEIVTGEGFRRAGDDDDELRREGKYAPTVSPEGVPAREPKEPDATQKQIDFLRRLGVRDESLLRSLGKKQASQAIQSVLQIREEMFSGQRPMPPAPAQSGCLALVAVFVLLVFLVVIAKADEPEYSKKWLKFEGCKYVPAPQNDGDSFFVIVDGHKRMLRLNYVDACESTDKPDYMLERLQEQAKHFGCTPGEALQAGKEAADLVKKWLEQPCTVHTRWASARGQSRLPRYYAVVKTADGKDVAEELVKAGVARVFGKSVANPTGEKAAENDARLKYLEAEARGARAGLWGKSKS
jgi:endonuclease YncB( thermonuclease family)